MRILLALLLVFSLAVSTANIAYAQEDTTATEEMASDTTAEEAAPDPEPMEDAASDVALAADETEQISCFDFL